MVNDNTWHSWSLSSKGSVGNHTYMASFFGLVMFITVFARFAVVLSIPHVQLNHTIEVKFTFRYCKK